MSDTQKEITHFLLRYSDLLLNVDTLAEHKSIVADKGHVWMGKFGQGASKRIVSKAQSQLREGRQTYLYLANGKGLNTRATIVDIVGGGAQASYKAPEPDCVPDYYRSRRCAIWFKLINFEDIEHSHIRQLRLANSPATIPTFNGMRALVYVFDREKD